MPIMFAENPKFDKYTLSQPNCFEMVSNQYKPLLLGLSFSLHMSTFIYNTNAFVVKYILGQNFTENAENCKVNVQIFALFSEKIVAANLEGPSKSHLCCYRAFFNFQHVQE